jgi:hypothetical protein
MVARREVYSLSTIFEDEEVLAVRLFFGDIITALRKDIVVVIYPARSWDGITVCCEW